MSDIVFIHRGDENFIDKSLDVAHKFNKEATIHFIGDEHNKKYENLPGVKHYDISLFDKGASEFREVYEHISANPPWIESLCFERFFVLRDFASTHNIDKLLYLDTDIFLLHDVAETHTNKEDLTLIFDESTYYSIWNQSALKEFCDFCISFYMMPSDRIIEYVKKYGVLNKYGVDMHFSDMYLLKCFVKEQCVISIKLLEEEATAQKGEYNIHFRKIYDDDDSKSSWVLDKDESFLDETIEWLDACPSYKSLQFKCIHFQGGAKKFIDYFYEDIKRGFVKKRKTKIEEDLKKQGYSLVKDWFSPQQAEEIKLELLHIYDQIPEQKILDISHPQQATVDKEYKAGKAITLKPVGYTIIPKLVELFAENEELNTVVESYLGKTYQKLMQIYSTYETCVVSDEEKGRQADLHIDPHASLKFAVFPIGSTKESGALRIIPGSREEGKKIRESFILPAGPHAGYLGGYPHRMMDFPADMVTFQEEDAQYLECSPTDLVILDTDIYHGGGVLLEDGKERLAVYLHNRP